jgi:hypothetical protein
MEKRRHVEHKLQPSKDSPDGGPVTKFDLVRTDCGEARRSAREDWRYDSDAGLVRETLTTFTRAELVTLIADGADWLAYLGDD